jgi:PAS domain S-box-containing protein
MTIDRHQDPDATAVAQSRLIERLAESERSIRDILINLPVIVARFDRHGKGEIQFVNMAWNRILGFDIDTSIGTAIHSYILIDDLEKWRTLVNNTKISDHDISDSQVRFKDSKGEIHWLKVKFDQRESGEATVLMEDFTERRRLDAELLRAQRLESIGRLAGGLAHDFNNLLQVIMGYIDLSQRLNKNNGIDAKYLKIASQACLRAAGLTKQMLTFSKGGNPVRMIWALQDVVKEAMEMSLHGSNVKGVIKCEPALPHVDIDSGQIHQVFNNIILNAEQAMPEGGQIILQIFNELDSKDGNLKETVVVEIIDCGTGIKPTDMDKIFDPFFTTKIHGTGLGLTSAYWIVKRHDGDLQIKSELGKGTIVRVSLPAVRNVETPLKAIVIDQKPLHCAKILIMDDEDMVRTSLRLMLEEHGHSVTTAQHGEECLNIYVRALNEENPFDLVILDLTISGGKGGIWTINQLRTINPSIKAILASGYSQDSILADYRKSGFSTVLQKPFDMQSLAKSLANVLKD